MTNKAILQSKRLVLDQLPLKYQTVDQLFHLNYIQVQFWQLHSQSNKHRFYMKVD